MNRHLAWATIFLFLFHAAASAAGDDRARPQWIWGDANREANQSVCLRTSFEVGEQLRAAQLIALADYCHSTIYVNGRRIARGEPYGRALQIDVAQWLREGENSLGVCCRSIDGPAAVMGRIELQYADGRRQIIATGPRWQAATAKRLDLPKWPKEKLAWRDAVHFGSVTPHRWGLEADAVRITPVDDYEQWKRAIDAEGATDPKTFQVIDGFEVELIRSAAEDEDSWVSLVQDPRGRWIIGMEKKGLLRLTLPEENSGEVRVERINDSLGECRGLVFAHGWLYAMANGDKALFRLRDTNGGERFDKIEKLAEFRGDAGHGRNQLTLGPDGHVWGIFGDSVFEPENANKLPPALANPTKAEKTRSGFVARFNEDASEIDIVVRGLRNPFGLDFNKDGELFTYDADAEYDMGSSWYRPTRVNHLLPGGDYRWRRVTTQWPPYFPDQADMPQPTLDVGKGSPTAVEFGAGSNFPPRYRDALFALDWAYGRVLAVHLTPRGSSYYASAETFLRGQPLNVTDVEFGRDGAMYFITGGRGTQSALYRVKYAGRPPEPPALTAQQQARRAHAQAARQTRRQLEKRIAQPDRRVAKEIWTKLGHEDPWIRHAARAALEKAPADAWRDAALKEASLDENEIDATLSARIALARMTPESPPPVDNFKARFTEASERNKLEMLYLAARSLKQRPDENTLADLRSLYPDTSCPVNVRLSQILSDDPDEEFVAKTLSLLERATAQREQLHYLFVLRHVQTGWTPAWRQTYFAHLQQMDDFVGGEGLPTFRKLIRQEAVAALPADERAKYEKLLEAQTPRWIAELPPARTDVVQTWTVDELAKAWATSKTQRDPANGKKMFAVARCLACHRCGGEGGVSGPDLSSVAQRFSPRDILTAIVEPSRVISEKYAAETFELESGRVITGRIAPGDYRSPQLEIVPNLMEPETTVTVAKADIAARTTSPVSPMPTGLLDTLNQEEILDLLAFLLQGDAERASAASP